MLEGYSKGIGVTFMGTRGLYDIGRATTKCDTDTMGGTSFCYKRTLKRLDLEGSLKRVSPFAGL